MNDGEKPWLNATLPVGTRVALLLAAMTLDEKVAQLGYGVACKSVRLSDVPLGLGGCGVDVAARGANTTNALRAALVNGTRLGIPPSVFGETTHSGGSLGTTVFPMPCSQGASWNVSLVEAIGRSNALQLRAAGGDHALSPVLQVATDPRFGRLEENFGEDPYIVGRLGIAAVIGLQGADGSDGASTYLGSARTHVVSQAKHYAMYGAAGKDGFTPFGGGVDVSGPWHRTFVDAHALAWYRLRGTDLCIAAALAHGTGERAVGGVPSSMARVRDERWARRHGSAQHGQLGAHACQQAATHRCATAPLRARRRWVQCVRAWACGCGWHAGVAVAPMRVCSAWRDGS